MRPALHHHLRQLHSWVGILCGFILFIAFYAGALSVFKDEIQRWQRPPQTRGTGTKEQDIGKFLSQLVARHPAAREQVLIGLPDGQKPLVARWFDKTSASWLSATPDTLERPNFTRSSDEKNSQLADFIYSLHSTLGIPRLGHTLMGIVCLFYGLALLTGLLIHMPRLKRDLFALRDGENRKRFWQDVHVLIGILNLPFHIIIALTGTLFSLWPLVIAILNPLAYDGRLEKAYAHAVETSPVYQASGLTAPMLNPEDLLAIARIHAPAMKATALRIRHYGDANASVEIFGKIEDALGSFSVVTLNASSGTLLAKNLPAERDLNRHTFYALYALHFGNFGGLLIRLVYFVLGMAGAILFFSGNLLWIESHRKRQDSAQPARYRRLAQATLGVCLGCCLGISAAAFATQTANYFHVPAIAWVERATAYTVFVLAVLWSFLRPPRHTAIELLSACALMTALLPLAHGLQLSSAIQSEEAGLGIDLGAFALAGCFAFLTVLTQRRLRQSRQSSVWTEDRLPSPELGSELEPAHNNRLRETTPHSSPKQCE